MDMPSYTSIKAVSPKLLVCAAKCGFSCSRAWLMQTNTGCEHVNAKADCCMQCKLHLVNEVRAQRYHTYARMIPQSWYAGQSASHDHQHAAIWSMGQFAANTQAMQVHIICCLIGDEQLSNGWRVSTASLPTSLSASQKNAIQLPSANV